jgi:predicted ATPase
MPANDGPALKITKLRASNFKGFRNLDANLTGLDVLVGANAAGKSTVLEALRFVRDVATQGLDNAVSLQGGARYLRNLKLGASEEFRLSLQAEHVEHFRYSGRKELAAEVDLVANRFTHTLALRFRQRGLGFEIAEDSIKMDVRVVQRRRAIEKKGLFTDGIDREDLGKGSITVSGIKDKVHFDVSLPPSVPSTIIDLRRFDDIRIPPGTLAFAAPIGFFLPLVHSWVNPFGFEIGLYDFDPKLPKRAAPITGKIELEGDGSNLALVLKSVIRDREKRRKLFNLVGDLLPFIEDVGVDSFADKSLLLKIHERLFPKSDCFPASSVSDGTINVLALILALYFERKSFAAIEEPERNIHPSLIAKVVDMIQDASKTKQILLTTQSPEILKHIGLEHLLLVARDEEGFCQITKPAENHQVRSFLQNNLGLDELYVSNLLES